MLSLDSKSPSFRTIAALTLCLVTACSDDSGSEQTEDVLSQTDAESDPGSSDLTGADPVLEAQCTQCHGTDELGTPPPDLSGSTDRTDRGVGAHEVHMTESDWHLRVRCSHCHPQYEAIDAPSHLDDERPADLVFSGLATSRCDPSWDETGCSVYCHGAGLVTAEGTSPSWTSTDQLSCDGCHGYPPQQRHPDATDCIRCHVDITDEEGGIARGHLHIDSVLQAPHAAHLVHLGGDGGPTLLCTDCHESMASIHGPLRDGNPLEDTTICDACHPSPDTVAPLQWRDYQPLWPVVDLND